MRRILELLLGLTVVVTSVTAQPAELIVERVLPIESDRLIEPSGLSERAGVLYSVADKKDETIYRLELHPDHARWVPALNLHPPAKIGGGLGRAAGRQFCLGE